MNTLPFSPPKVRKSLLISNKIEIYCHHWAAEITMDEYKKSSLHPHRRRELFVTIDEKQVFLFYRYLQQVEAVTHYLEFVLFQQLH